MALRTCNTSTVLVSNLNEVVKDSASKFGSHCRFCCFFFPSSYWPWISICKMLAKSLLHSSRMLFIIFIFLYCSQKMLRTQCREQTGEHRRGLYITVTPPSIHTPHSFCISVPCLLGKKKKKILKKKRNCSSANELHWHHSLALTLFLFVNHLASGLFLGSIATASIAACRMVLSALP